MDFDDSSNNNGSELIPVNRRDMLPADLVRSYFDKEEEVHLRDYLEVLLRRKWTIIVVLITVVTTVTVSSFLSTPTFKATSSVWIGKENPNVLDFNDVYQNERYVGLDYYETQYKILRSRNLAMRVIKKLELYKEPSFGAVSAGSGLMETDLEEKLGGDAGTRLVNSFLGSVVIEPARDSQIVEINFISHDPQLAAKVANGIAYEYIELNLDSKLGATQQARRWLEKQIESLRAKLEVSEERLNSYIAEKGIIFLNQSEDYQTLHTQKLAELSKELGDATADRISKESLYNEIRESGINNSAVLNNNMVQSLKSQVTELESEYSKLLKIYKTDYPMMVSIQQQMENLNNNIDREINKIVRSIEADYNAALKREAYLSSDIENIQKQVIDLQQKMIQYQILKREVDTNRDIYNNLLQRLKEVGVSTTLSASNIQVLDKAEVPLGPYKPNKARNITFAFIIGFFGGVFLSFFIEYFDNTIKSVEEIEKKHHMPVLGVIPESNMGDASFMITPSDRGAVTEAFRSLVTYIQFSSPSKAPKTILVTSPLEKEGKTTVSVNTAISLLTFYGKGIIVDADMRKPFVYTHLDLGNSVGLSSYLSGMADVDEIIQRTEFPDLDVITSGPVPPNPSELLSSPGMKSLIDNLGSRYAFIIVDSPPVLGMSDAPILGTLAEGTIMIVKAGETPSDALQQAKKIMNSIQARILGVVLNRVDDNKYGYYSYYYYRYYGYERKGKKIEYS